VGAGSAAAGVASPDVAAACSASVGSTGKPARARRWNQRGEPIEQLRRGETKQICPPGWGLGISYSNCSPVRSQHKRSRAKAGRAQ
jgi:hypothetical protein